MRVPARFSVLLLAVTLMLQGRALSQGAYVLRPVAGFPHSRASEHFAVLWTDTLGLPFSDRAADSGLAQLEGIRDFYLGKLGFHDPYAAAAIKYKTNLYLITTGWAFGGVDAGHPAMWLHPDAFRDPWALAHEYDHDLQFGAGGFTGNDFTGWFWESHANWMAHQYHPDDPHCAEHYTRSATWYYGSTRNRYCNWQFLEYLKDAEGIGLVNRLWSEGWPAPSSPAYKDEDFFRALMRLKGWDFAKLGDAWGAFALRMARYDFANGAVYRSKWEHGRPDWQMRLTRTPMETLDSARRRYVVPEVFAPQRYGYNIVRLRREAGQSRVQVVFQGVVQDRNNIPGYRKVRSLEPDSISAPGSGWRFGLVAVDTVRTAFRYSPLMASGEVYLDLQPAESEIYLVVAATPANRQLIKWDQMYYTLYRYPWMCEVHGAWPDGSQSGADASPAGVAGARHANGGGFVAATATVSATAFVGSQARVLGRAKVSGTARIEGHAVVGESGEVMDNAVVAGYAGVWAGVVSENARIDGAANIVVAGTRISGSAHLGGQALTWDPAVLSGTVQILGDAEIRNVTASKGVFYGMVDQDAVGKADMGADRTKPETEATRPGPYAWIEGAGIRAGPSPASRKRYAGFLIRAGGVPTWAPFEGAPSAYDPVGKRWPLPEGGK